MTNTDLANEILLAAQRASAEIAYTGELEVAVDLRVIMYYSPIVRDKVEYTFDLLQQDPLTLSVTEERPEEVEIEALLVQKTEEDLEEWNIRQFAREAVTYEVINIGVTSITGIEEV